MSRFHVIPVVLILALAGLQSSAIAGELPQNKTTTAATRPAAPRAFTPPADGRLTEQQIATYLAVRRQVAANLPAASAAAPADIVAQLSGAATAESAAIKTLGVDVDEYQWVSARISEASTPSHADPLIALLEANARTTAADLQLKAATGGSPDAPAVSSSTNSAARTYNRALVNKHRKELDALQDGPR